MKLKTILDELNTDIYNKPMHELLDEESNELTVKDFLLNVLLSRE
jgi:hypothetical protein